MSKKLVKLNGTFSVVHRAQCEEGDFTGPDRSDITQAYTDASKHRAQAGNRDHVITIVTEQTSARTFIDVDG